MDIGRILLTVGIIFVIIGVIMTFLPQIGLFRLPGDMLVKRENFTFYFPIATSILLSIVLSLIFYFFRK